MQEAYADGSKNFREWRQRLSKEKTTVLMSTEETGGMCQMHVGGIGDDVKGSRNAIKRKDCSQTPQSM